MVAAAYPPSVQRPALLDLVKALGCRDNALRRDECGDWRVEGRHGHVYAVPGFQFFVMGWTTKGWNAAKAALAFAERALGEAGLERLRSHGFKPAINGSKSGQDGKVGSAGMVVASPSGEAVL